MIKKMGLILFFLLITSCSKQSLIDSKTSKNIKELVPSANMIIYNHLYDNMDFGNHDYANKVVVDPDYYKSKTISRGDVIYYDASTYNNKLTMEISRVVGLSGETIKIDKGQIYINNKPQDSFYGSAHMRGFDYKAFQKAELPTDMDRSEANKQIYEINKPETKIPDGSFFVVGDDWSRSHDSKEFGPISKNIIKGKVLGVCTACKK
jgi:signal peptidase I